MQGTGGNDSKRRIRPRAGLGDDAGPHPQKKIKHLWFDGPASASGGWPPSERSAVSSSFRRFPAFCCQAPATVRNASRHSPIAGTRLPFWVLSPVNPRTAVPTSLWFKPPDRTMLEV